MQRELTVHRLARIERNQYVCGYTDSMSKGYTDYTDYTDPPREGYRRL